MHGFRTDLAMEAYDGSCCGALEGVHVKRRESSGVSITEVAITDDDASRMLNKPVGRYLTLECAALRRRDLEARGAMARLLTEEIARMLPKEACEGACTLVVGLGNRGITPDSLGPAVIDRTLVTRHLDGRLHPMSKMRSVSAIAPGVLGVTGIETMELVESLVRLTRPAAVICVDSLAARDSARIGTAVQLSDAGIQPGAGVGNRRQALTRQSVGAPVIAIGMPTVIYAATLARDAFAWLNRSADEASPHEEALDELERALFDADVGEMIVTPREIDAMIQDAAGIIARAINHALQPDLTDADIAVMTD